MFTGPKAIAEVLVKKTGGFRSNAPIDGFRVVWEDFGVPKKGGNKRAVERHTR
jgi:hypothetical protein